VEQPTGEETQEQQRDLARVEAFSDGVFAFAVTLLVITIRIPRLNDPDASEGLQKLVLQQWPSYIAFAITFAVVGAVWANHRLMFSHLARADHVLVSLNLLELMSVAFLPVPTGILGTWVMSDRNRFFAVIFYGTTLVILGIVHNLMWWYAAYWARLTSPHFPEAKRRALSLTWIVGPVAYAVCVGLAWLDPRVSLVGFALLAILYLLPTPRALMQAQRARELRRSARAAPPRS
jgi:uncharacterized membrane protein